MEYKEQLKCVSKEKLLNKISIYEGWDFLCIEEIRIRDLQQKVQSNQLSGIANGKTKKWSVRTGGLH